MTKLKPKAGRRSENNELKIQTASELCAAVYRCPVSTMLGRSKLRQHSRARQLMAWLLREYTDLSLPEIGEAVGGRNHTSMLRGVRSVAERKAESGLYFGMVRAVCEEFENRVALSTSGWATGNVPEDVALKREESSNAGFRKGVGVLSD